MALWTHTVADGKAYEYNLNGGGVVPGARYHWGCRDGRPTNFASGCTDSKGQAHDDAIAAIERYHAAELAAEAAREQIIREVEGMRAFIQSM